MPDIAASMRYGFGRNWQRFVKLYLDDSRIAIARRNLLENLSLATLDGQTFLDVGSGSGIHSLAAFQAGASRIVSFDYDPASVAATRALWQAVGAPSNWMVMQGSVLDPGFLDTLAPADITYSWGVLHHTGRQWEAIGNLAERVRPGGMPSIALYADEAYADPPPAFWLAVKQAYNNAGRFSRLRRELAWVWYSDLKRNLGKLRRTIVEYRRHRGMAYWTDVSDWMGGWPMEFSTVAQVTEFCAGRHGLALTQLRTGEGNSEFLFRRPRPGEDGAGLEARFTTLERPEDLLAVPAFFLFGTGSGAQRLLVALRSRGVEPDGVFDPNREGVWEGLRVYSEAEAAAHADTRIVVASSYFGNVLERLAALGCQRIVNGFPAVVELMRREHAAEGKLERRFRWML